MKEQFNTAIADSQARDEYILGQPPRLTALPEEELTDAQRRSLDYFSVMVVDGVRLPREDVESIKILIRHSELYGAHMEFARKFLSDGEISIRDRELAVLRIGWLSQAPFEWGAHVEIAKRSGVSPTEVEWLIEGSTAPGWSDRDRAIIRAMEELHFDSMITDETWAALAHAYSDKQLIEIIMLAGHYKTVAYLQNSLKLPLLPAKKGLSAR